MNQGRKKQQMEDSYWMIEKASIYFIISAVCYLIYNFLAH